MTWKIRSFSIFFNIGLYIEREHIKRNLKKIDDISLRN